MALTIAIDGPVGAGKSTIASMLAHSLGILHLDTGAMYRALALKALREDVDPRDAGAAEALCARTDIRVGLNNGGQRTFLDGEDVTGLIRTPEVSAAASAISLAAGVRRDMVLRQRRCAQQADMVVDGRDIGTRVLPDAAFKFFLTASPEIRARRRYDELRAHGVACDYAQVLRELIARDRQDTTRAVDPLRRAEDALEIDSSGMTQEQVVQTMLRVVKERKA